MELTVSILSTNSVITNGKAHSTAASPIINKGVIIAYFLNSLTLFRTLNIDLSI